VRAILLCGILLTKARHTKTGYWYPCCSCWPYISVVRGGAQYSSDIVPHGRRIAKLINGADSREPLLVRSKGIKMMPHVFRRTINDVGRLMCERSDIL
jgi:hypothetical protein